MRLLQAQDQGRTRLTTETVAPARPAPASRPPGCSASRDIWQVRASYEGCVLPALPDGDLRRQRGAQPVADLTDAGVAPQKKYSAPPVAMAISEAVEAAANGS